MLALDYQSPSRWILRENRFARLALGMSLFGVIYSFAMLFALGLTSFFCNGFNSFTRGAPIKCTCVIFAPQFVSMAFAVLAFIHFRACRSGLFLVGVAILNNAFWICLLAPLVPSIGEPWLVVAG